MGPITAKKPEVPGGKPSIKAAPTGTTPKTPAAPLKKSEVTTAKKPEVTTTGKKPEITSKKPEVTTSSAKKPEVPGNKPTMKAATAFASVRAFASSSMKPQAKEKTKPKTSQPAYELGSRFATPPKKAK